MYTFIFQGPRTENRAKKRRFYGFSPFWACFEGSKWHPKPLKSNVSRLRKCHPHQDSREHGTPRVFFDPFLKKSQKSPKKGQNEPFWPFLPFMGPICTKPPFFLLFFFLHDFQFADPEKCMYTFFQNLSMGVFERRYASVQKTPLFRKKYLHTENIAWGARNPPPSRLRYTG